MSPERKPAKNSASRGWAIHERRRKAEERKIERSSLPTQTITTQEERQRKFSIASWTDTLGLLNIYTANNEALRPLYEEIVQPLIDRDFIERDMLREWYGACYKDANTGNGQENRYRSEYVVKHIGLRADEPFDPLLAQRAAPLRKLVEQFVIKNKGE